MNGIISVFEQLEAAILLALMFGALVVGAYWALMLVMGKKSQSD